MKQVKVKFMTSPFDGIAAGKVYDAVFVQEGGDIVAALPALSLVYGDGPFKTMGDCLCLIDDDDHPCDLFVDWIEFEYVE